MREVMSAKLRRVVAAGVLACALLAIVVATASAEEFNAEYNKAYEVGLSGYIYGQPLLDLQRLYQSNTSVTVPDGQGDAPVNEWSHFPELATTKEGEIVSPNADTLYSYAWLELAPARSSCTCPQPVGSTSCR